MSLNNLTRVQIRSSFEPKTRLRQQLWQVGDLQASRGATRRVNVLVPPLRSSRQVVEISRYITLILVRQGPFVELFSKPIRNRLLTWESTHLLLQEDLLLLSLYLKLPKEVLMVTTEFEIPCLEQRKG